jgi:SNF2 family DNA or RNA helicase
MARKRTLERSDSDEDDDDDFLSEALKDQKRYREEIEVEQKAREEAEKANRKYIKGKKKKKKPLGNEEEQLFDRLRKQLKLSRQEAMEIREASMDTLNQRRRRSDMLSFIDMESDPSISTEEEEEDVISIKTESKVGNVQLRVDNGGNALPSSDSEEEVIMLSLPQKREALALPSLHDTALKDASRYIPIKMPLQVNRAFPPKKEDSDSSDEEVISLSFAPRPTGQVKIENEREKSPTVLAVPTPSAVPTASNSESISSEVKTGANASEQSGYLLIPDGYSRPAFPLLPSQLNIGPLILDSRVQVPAAINRFLRDYQREGIQFFFKSYKEGRGGLLGDDMGLGKTIQVIGFLSAIMGKSGTESSDFHRRINSIRAGRFLSRPQGANADWPTCLIICPASVMTNWQNELDTWGYFEHALLDDDSLRDFERGRLDILITSHQMAKLRMERLKEMRTSVVIVDECHTLKNPASHMTQALNSMPCLSRFGLTGTAIQNRFEEFWTLLDWSNPKQFGDIRHWQQLVAEPIRKGQLATATMVELGHGRRIAEQLKYCLLPAYFLRRTKALIKSQLPNKRDNIVFCPLTPLQVKSYKMILAEPEVQLIKRAKEPCDCGEVDEAGLPYQRCRCCHKTGPDGKRWNYHMLKYIMLLQRCSNHLALVFPDPQDNIEVNADSTQADQMRKFRYHRQIGIVQQMFPNAWQSKQNNKINGFTKEYCGKWLILRTLLQEWKANGDKVLLFSLNLRLLDWIAYFVEMEGYRHVRLDGSVPQKKRQGLVDDFNRDASIFIFLISTTAGGTGLNLTGANKVVVFDPHWNPAHDLQAMDRAYRFGQTRDVDVYRLIGKGSLEEAIYDRQIYKQQMGRIGYDASEERRYLEPGDAKGFVRLFELHETGNITKEIIKACDLAEATFALQHVVKDAEVAKVKLEDGDEELEGLLNTQQESLEGAAEEDPMAKMLQMTGIEYSHVNDKLFGGSRAESAMSRKARMLTSASSENKEKKHRVSLERAPRRTKAEIPDTPLMTAWPPKRSTSTTAGPSRD